MNSDAVLPPLDPARVREVASFLDSRPISLAPSRKNRAPWEGFAAAEPETARRILGLAEGFLGQPAAALTDQHYLDSRRTGDRQGYPAQADLRRTRLTLFTLAEGLENRGRFLSAANREIALICSERVWVSPPHDWNCRVFEGVQIDVDLISAMTAWNLAAAAAILGDGIEPEVRLSLREKVRRNVTGPYLAALRGLRGEEWWTRNAYNWNAVAHAGIIGAALSLDGYSPGERAEMIAGAERELPYYLNGFPADGYSPEGVGYWRYGFGHYALLAEAILAATGGKLSLYGSEHARRVARFPERFELVPSTHFYPPFADARFPEPAAPWLSYLLDRRFGLGGGVPRVVTPEGDFEPGFFSTFLYAWGILLSFDPEAAMPPAEVPLRPPDERLRDWFEESQVLVVRQPPGAQGLNVAIKGGNNGVSHGHNDLGTFVVAAGEVPLIVDPGLIVYGAAAFGPGRFQNQIMGSYGHPVPLVAGAWQGTGAEFSASVTETMFRDAADRIGFDLTRAYPVASLRHLTRRFEYERNAGGALTICDSVAFDSPQAFGAALVTYGEVREESGGVWIVAQEGASVRVEIEAGGLPFTVQDEILRDESRVGKVRRLGIDLRFPVEKATLRMRITPLVLPPPAGPREPA